MAPHSPATDQIDALVWIGFIAAAIVFVAINVALLSVVRRGRAQRGAEPRQVSGGRRLQFRVAGALTVFAVVLFVLGIVFTDKSRDTPATGPEGLVSQTLESAGGAGESAASAEHGPLEIEATGQQWLWRYNYPNGAFSYYQLVIPVDTLVRLKLVSTDVVHTWNVPDLAGKEDAVPGKTSYIQLRADEEGSFTGDAATLSGQGYSSMRTEVKVVSPAEYEEFLETQKSDIEAAQERVVGLIENGEVP
ncbi:MAG: hypothetical protein U0R71_05895 [Solirubrobacterales bacterium]